MDSSSASLTYVQLLDEYYNCGVAAAISKAGASPRPPCYEASKRGSLFLCDVRVMYFSRDFAEFIGEISASGQSYDSADTAKEEAARIAFEEIAHQNECEAKSDEEYKKWREAVALRKQRP